MNTIVVECEDRNDYQDALEHSEAESHSVDDCQLRIRHVSAVSEMVDGQLRVRFRDEPSLRVGSEGSATPNARIISAY